MLSDPCSSLSGLFYCIYYICVKDVFIVIPHLQKFILSSIAISKRIVNISVFTLGALSLGVWRLTMTKVIKFC